MSVRPAEALSATASFSLENLLPIEPKPAKPKHTAPLHFSLRSAPSLVEKPINNPVSLKFGPEARLDRLPVASSLSNVATNASGKTAPTALPNLSFNALATSPMI